VSHNSRVPKDSSEYTSSHSSTPNKSAYNSSCGPSTNSYTPSYSPPTTDARQSKLQEYKETDQRLRKKILTREYTPETEAEITFNITMCNIFKHTYPYLYKHEWEVVEGRSQHGRGDLVFTNGKNSYLIVECKYINQNGGKTARSARRQKRRKAELQAWRYAEIFAQLTPQALQVGYVHITNESHTSMETAEDRIQYLRIQQRIQTHNTN